MLRSMKVLGIQFDIAWENKPANFAKVRQMLAQAAPESGSLVVLPEMFATGFSMNAAAIAELPGAETTGFLTTLAREFCVTVLAGAAVLGIDGRPRNHALACAPDGSLLASYAKMRPFSPGGETDHYAAGDQVAIFRWNECSVSPFICYDLRFPELFRAAARAQAPELFAVIASWPAKRVSHWVRLLQARAIENQAYVIGVNRVGNDPYFKYSGRSLIIDPQCEILADAGEIEGCVSAALDLPALRQYRHGLPFLADLRPL